MCSELTRRAELAGKHIVVVGAGGNIGSHLLALLARLTNLARLTLIDPDVYEASNLPCQNIAIADVGHPKVLVLANRLREINPALTVIPLQEPVEAVALGQLRADVIVAGVDSRVARQHINEIAWHLGIPWVDAGVQAAGGLVRMNVYVPSDTTPCLECAWSDADYATLEQVYPCQGQLTVPATRAPAHLGTLAASLQAAECEKLLTRRTHQTLAGRQFLIDTRSWRTYLTSFKRNARCRFDHKTWCVNVLPALLLELTVEGFLTLIGQQSDVTPLGLSVAEQAFVQRLNCQSCGWTKGVLHLSERPNPSERVCGRCAGPLVASGFDMTEILPLHPQGSEPPLTNEPLKQLGLRRGDILTVVEPTGRKTHFQLGDCDDR